MLAACVLVCGAALLMSRASASVAPVSGASESKSAIEKLLEEFVADTPTPGHFYQVQPGDTPLSVALAALGDRATVADATDYLHCIASGTYNMSVYGSPSTSKQFPAKFLVPGKRIGVRVAFLPRNEDALDLMLRGRHPRMTIDQRTGAPLGGASSYGMPWLPPVDERFSCAPFEWDDGSSAIDPPPDLLERLR